jgi:hypothetical protein
MANKDFQNGFALGLASGGTVVGYKGRELISIEPGESNAYNLLDSDDVVHTLSYTELGDTISAVNFDDAAIRLSYSDTILNAIADTAIDLGKAGYTTVDAPKTLIEDLRGFHMFSMKYTDADGRPINIEVLRPAYDESFNDYDILLKSGYSEYGWNHQTSSDIVIPANHRVRITFDISRGPNDPDKSTSEYNHFKVMPYTGNIEPDIAAEQECIIESMNTPGTHVVLIATPPNTDYKLALRINVGRGYFIRITNFSVTDIDATEQEPNIDFQNGFIIGYASGSDVELTAADSSGVIEYDGYTYIGDEAFKDNSNIGAMDAAWENAWCGDRAFEGSALRTAYAYTGAYKVKGGSTIVDGTFRNCTNLKTVYSDYEIIGINTFEGCTSLKRFIVRTIRYISIPHADTVFAGTPIADGTGYIYVAKPVIAYNRNKYPQFNFRVLEDYTVDGTLSGALDESKLRSGE